MQYREKRMQFFSTPITLCIICFACVVCLFLRFLLFTSSALFALQNKNHSRSLRERERDELRGGEEEGMKRNGELLAWGDLSSAQEENAREEGWRGRGGGGGEEGRVALVKTNVYCYNWLAAAAAARAAVNCPWSCTFHTLEVFQMHLVRWESLVHCWESECDCVDVYTFQLIKMRTCSPYQYDISYSSGNCYRECESQVWWIVSLGVTLSLSVRQIVLHWRRRSGEKMRKKEGEREKKAMR